MHQDTHEKMADAAAEALKHPGEEPYWQATLDDARRHIVELDDEIGMMDTMAVIRQQVITDLRDEVARMEQEAAANDIAILRAATMSDIRGAAVVEFQKTIARLLAEREQLQARASRTIWERVKDAFYG